MIRRFDLLVIRGTSRNIKARMSLRVAKTASTGSSLEEAPTLPCLSHLRLSAQTSGIGANASLQRQSGSRGSRTDTAFVCNDVAIIGTAPGTGKGLSKWSAQSSRPLPRWYWESIKQGRWRKFKDEVSAKMQDISEKTGLSKIFSESLQMRIVTWDETNLRGTFRFADMINGVATDPGPSKAVLRFERFSQEESINIQVNNFVFTDKHEGDYIKAYSHVESAFREMMVNERKYSASHVFFYHSYGATALLYDLGGCIMRAAFSDTKTNNGTSVLPRTDRSSFNGRSVEQVVTRFDELFGSDWHPEFKEIGLSCVLNCLLKDSEATVVEYFKGNYQVGGTVMNSLLDQLLTKFSLTGIKKKLLNRTLEADVDVAPYFKDTRCYRREKGSNVGAAFMERLQLHTVRRWRSEKLLH